MLSSVINSAVKENIMSHNPCRAVKLPKVEEKEKIFLTLKELKLLVKTDCRHIELKRAFLFSCLTGLRWSDVSKLK
jgi:integrase